MVGPSATGARWSLLSVLTTNPARSMALTPESAVIPNPMVDVDELSKANLKLGVVGPLQVVVRFGGMKLLESVSEECLLSRDPRPEPTNPRSYSWAPSSRTRSYECELPPKNGSLPGKVLRFLG